MNLISIKSTSLFELERLCLHESKISEIESEFQMTKKSYCNLIVKFFVNDSFLKEIDDFLAFNYPLSTQDCLKSTLSPTKTKESTSSSPETTLNLKNKKSTSSPAKSKDSISSSLETKKCTASTSKLIEKKGTSSPAKSKESTSSSPETTLNLKDKKVLRHRQN